jgi:sugar O-acyltransferase (sialic acid O-acetyltransferase NeuD family)
MRDSLKGESANFETPNPVSYSAEDMKSYLADLSHFIVAIWGEIGKARFNIHTSLIEVGLSSTDLRSNAGFVDNPTHVGSGLVLIHGAVVNKFCKMGEQCIVNTNASVDHECMLGDGAHVMGAAVIAGKVPVGDYASIGTNATVLPNLTIGKGAFVGAGAVGTKALVTKNVEDYSVVVVSPAREIKKNK